MNLVYISTLGTYAVCKEPDYRYFELVELRPAAMDTHWEVICGYVELSGAIQAAEAKEKWELFGEKKFVFAQGVPKEDLPPHPERTPGGKTIW
jgi:hypothetical protein